jgi:hypothetical protein
MFSRVASLSLKTRLHKLDRLRPPSPWTNDLADEGVAVFVVQASRFTNTGQIKTNDWNLLLNLLFCSLYNS